MKLKESGFSVLGFRCYYCNRQRKGRWKNVDGYRSCEKCNRAYDYQPEEIKIKCPTCDGKGYFK
jgi:hypothetical protein